MSQTPTFLQGALRTPTLHFVAWAHLLMVCDDQGRRKCSVEAAAAVTVEKLVVGFVLFPFGFEFTYFS